jgi:transcriptional regulator with PAS, ATPase and Fis domain
VTSAAHPLPTAGSVTIGRGPHNDIDIDDPSISRRHAVLHIGPPLSIEDMGSTNGTRVRPLLGKRRGLGSEDTAQIPQRRPTRSLMQVELGDVVSIGSVTLVVRPLTSGMFSIVRAPAPDGAGRAEPMVRDPEMQRILRMTERLAHSTICVLYQGETGVGKEVFAETLHRLSPRRAGPFLRLNCGALPESLLESHLFGHERGAFTGAAQTKPGLLETASGGTVFLDEVGELPKAVQVKLLRVLEERQVLRIGGLAPRPIDVRFVTATNRDLEDEIARGAFRQDLYYRIGAVALTIPPLRERRSEIEPLARALLSELCRAEQRGEPAFDSRVIELMQNHAWPGNVRELKNVVARALALCDSGPILLEHLPCAKLQRESRIAPPEAELPTCPQAAPLPESLGDLRRKLEEAERDRVVRALDECAGNQTQAARLLGMSRRTLVTRLESFGLPRPRKRIDAAG